MLRCVILLCIITTSVLARSSSTHFNTITETKPSTTFDDKETESTSIWTDVSSAYKTYRSCADNELSVCLKLKLIGAIQNASKVLKDFEIVSGVKFIKLKDVKEQPSLKESEILQLLPRSNEGKENALTTLLWEKIVSFFQSHTLQVKFPSEEEIKRSFSEARKKKDKKEKGHMIMIPLLLGGTMIPMAYGALALLAGKALIVSKLALVLASIIGIKKLVSSSGGHQESHEVVVSGGHGGSGWGRDFDLAYNAFIPKDRTQSKKL